MRCDDVTPPEVWQEYEHQKARIDEVLERALRQMYADRDEAIHRLEDALGCGVPCAALTADQRAKQTAAVRKWQSAFGSGGCAP